MTPAEAAKEATAQAAVWIAASPPITDTLTWHQQLCDACWPGRKCGEYHDIITEYGAGENGAAVFWPAGGVGHTDSPHSLMQRSEQKYRYCTPNQ